MRFIRLATPAKLQTAQVCVFQVYPGVGVCVCECVFAAPGAFGVVYLCCLLSINRASDLPANMPPNSSAVPLPCKYIGVSFSDDEMSI